MLTTLQGSISFHEVLELMPKFAKFMKVLLNGTKHKLDKEHVNMTDKCDTTLLQTIPTKQKEPCKFTIPCTIGWIKIPHALCDLDPSINVMRLNKTQELNLVEIIPSNMTLTLAYLSVTHHYGILRDMLVHFDSLLFPTDFVVVDVKGDAGILWDTHAWKPGKR